MKMHTSQKHSILLDGSPIEALSGFKYLDVTAEHPVECLSEIHASMLCAAGIFAQLNTCI